MILEVALLMVLVRPGDTLSGIAASHGESLAHLEADNPQFSSNWDLIFPGQRVFVTAGQASEREPDGDADDRTSSGPRRSAAATPQYHGYYGGTLSYQGLEGLWEAAGGARWAAPTAACIAMHESGGRQYATGAAGERGYWQIHPDHGYLSTYNALGNAKAAIIISADGRSWAPWTTHWMCGV